MINYQIRFDLNDNRLYAEIKTYDGRHYCIDLDEKIPEDGMTEFIGVKIYD